MKYKIVTREDDIEKICDVIVEALKDSSYKDFTPSRDKLKELIESFYAHECEGKRFLLVAEEDEEYVGIVGGLLIEGHFLLGNVCQEVIWWVHQDHRKSGVAKDLLEGLESWAKFLKVPHLLMSHYENEHSSTMKKMYNKMGYILKEYNYYKEIK